MSSIYRACNLLFFNFVVFNLRFSVSLFWEFYFFLKKSYWNKTKKIKAAYFNMTQVWGKKIAALLGGVVLSACHAL